MRFNSLNDWLDWQSSLHLKSIDLGLERAAKVWSDLHPQPLNAFVITVAGTNGKGSSVAMLEAILLAAGYTVGCYTSPHLVRYNERIRINGKEARDEQICEAFAAIDDSRGETTLSYFEYGTLAALQLFSSAAVEVVVLEVGLGGRLDAVNIIDADAALITSIGLDHQDWLGDTLEEIGREKAGILRSSQKAVFSGKILPASIQTYADQIGCNLKIAGEDFNYINQATSWDFVSPEVQRNALPLPALRGSQQLQNAAGVVALLMLIKDELAISMDAIRQGLLCASVKGRFQVMQQQLNQGRVNIVVDVAHNEQSMQALAENLAAFVVKGQLHIIIGMLKDKDQQHTLLPLIEQADYWHLLDTPGERGMPAKNLADILRKLLPEADCHLHENISDAYDSVLQYAQEGDTILVTGSFLVAGAFLEKYD